MKLKAYLQTLSREQRRNLAQRCGTTESYLAQLKGGHRVPSHRLCRKFVIHTGGLLTLEEMRPDIWRRKKHAESCTTPPPKPSVRSPT